MSRSSRLGRVVLVVAIGLTGSQLITGSSARDAAAPAAASCGGKAAIDFACHARRYGELARREGARTALRTLAADQRRNGYVRAACHQLTHRIGRAAGSLHGIDALAHGQSVCASGYYHGVLQAVMGRAGPSASVRAAGSVCATTRPGGRSAEHYNCVHGMGHGFMEVFASDVFDSLHGCRALRDRWEQDECTGGVFMENVTAIDDPRRPSRSLRPGEPLYPCTAVARRYWEQCYDWQVTYALYVGDGDFGGVFARCAASVRAARRPCYRGLGGDAMQQSKFVTSEPARRATIARLCALGPDRAARSACIEGAVRNLYRDYADGDLQARALCASLRRRSTARAACERAEAQTRREVALPEASARMSRRTRIGCAALAAAALLGAALLLAAGTDRAGDPVARCTGAATLDFACHERRSLEIVAADGPAAALRDLAAAMRRSGYVRAACHQLTHRIGRRAGASGGIAAFEDGDPVCGSGYYHGVTEAVMQKLGASAAIRRAASVCAGLRAGRTADASTCVHGMGHGFMGVLGATSARR